MILVGIGASLATPDGTLPRETCRAAASALDRLPGLRLRALSRWWESAPIPPMPGAPWFVNGVARLSGSADPAALLANFVRLLNPGGTLIASVPVTPSVDVNPYHLHDFTERSFRALGASLGLVEIDSLAQRQPFDPWKIASGKEARLDDMRKGMPLYYAQHPRALTKRLWSTVRDGFCNKYLTIAWTKGADQPVN